MGRSYSRTEGLNVAPSETMPVVVEWEQTQLVPMEWGLLPHWAKDPATVRRPINARAETLAERPMFRGLLKHNRCLVPASGFYEGKKEGDPKTPYSLRLKDEEIFAFAGLYHVGHDVDGAALATYTLIITAANEVVAPINDRMPMILKREEEERWIASNPPEQEEIHDLLGQYPAHGMEAYPVSTRVNSPMSDNPALIEPLEKA